jgi:hypothetical protein
MTMAIHIHLEEEPTPRLTAFDTPEVADYAAGLMGLSPGTYTLVDGEDRPANVWIGQWRRDSDRSSSCR